MISLYARMVDLEENSRAEDCDIELLKEVNTTESQELQTPMYENIWIIIFLSWWMSSLSQVVNEVLT